MQEIKVATLNLGKGATKFLPPGYSKQDVEGNLQLVANLIYANSFDVVGLQEVDVNTNRNRGIDEPSFLRDELNWPTRSSRFEPAIDFSGGKFGNSILMNLSRDELRYKDQKIQRKRFPRVVGKEDRSAIAIRADIRQPEGSKREFKNLWFVATHLGIPFCDWTSQLCQILSWIDEFSFPVFVCGDLNVRERSEDGRTTEYGLLKDMFEKYGFLDLGPFGDGNFTFPRRATKKIDYMFLRDNRSWFDVDWVGRIRPRVNGEWISDHWALACTLSY